MKELQKYYATTSELYRTVCSSGDVCTAIYIAAEADAAFAEMDQANAELIGAVIDGINTHAALMREHAEEVERLKVERQAMHRRAQQAEQLTKDLDARLAGAQASIEIQIEIRERYRKQAERYEKLSNVSPRQFERLSWGDGKSSFDEMVDQLPASAEFSQKLDLSLHCIGGEASADEQASRTE